MAVAHQKLNCLTLNNLVILVHNISPDLKTKMFTDLTKMERFYCSWMYSLFAYKKKPFYQTQKSTSH